MTTVTPTSILSPSPDVVARNIAGEHLLVPVRSGVASMDCLFMADGAGGFVWSCLDGRRDLVEVARLVAAEFEVDPTRALEEVTTFAAELVDTGLAHTTGEGR